LGLNERYAEDFFIDNSLVIFIFGHGHDFDAETTRVSKSKNELLIEIEVNLGRLASVQKSIIIIEVSKSDIGNINKLRVNEYLI
jgi:hypothetical protein